MAAGMGIIIAAHSRRQRGKDLLEFCTDENILELRREFEKKDKDELKSLLKEYEHPKFYKFILASLLAPRKFKEISEIYFKGVDFWIKHKRKSDIIQLILSDEYKKIPSVEDCKFIEKGKETRFFEKDLKGLEFITGFEYERVSVEGNYFFFDLSPEYKVESYIKAGKLNIDALIYTEDYHYTKEDSSWIHRGKKGIPIRKIS